MSLHRDDPLIDNSVGGVCRSPYKRSYTTIRRYGGHSDQSASFFLKIYAIDCISFITNACLHHWRAHFCLSFWQMPGAEPMASIVVSQLRPWPGPANRSKAAPF